MGNGRTRDGYMRALRILNPRYRADSWLPAGTTIRATTRITGLYKRYCVDGARAELAQPLVMSDPAAAIVHAGDTGPATGSPTVTAMVPGPTQIATGVATSASKPPEHRAVRGDTLVSTSRRSSCDTKTLAKANNLQAPRYAISQGTTMQLPGCTR